MSPPKRLWFWLKRRFFCRYYPIPKDQMITKTKAYWDDYYKNQRAEIDRTKNYPPGWRNALFTPDDKDIQN